MAPSTPIVSSTTTKLCIQSTTTEMVSLSLKTAEQEKALRQRGSEVGPSKPRGPKLVEVDDLETLTSLTGRLEEGSSSVPDEVEEAEEQPLVRNRSRLISSRSINSSEDIE